MVYPGDTFTRESRRRDHRGSAVRPRPRHFGPGEEVRGMPLHDLATQGDLQLQLRPLLLRGLQGVRLGLAQGLTHYIYYQNINIVFMPYKK